MASAKLAKTTVNHSQMATASTKKISKLRWVRSSPAVGWAKSRRTNSMVVTTLPISTTNITGFLTCTRGSSFLNDSGMAARMILGSQMERSPLRRVFHCLTSSPSVGSSRCILSVCILEHLPCMDKQMFDDRSQRVGREVGQRTHDQDHAEHERDPQWPRRREGAHPGGHDPLLHQRAA